MHTSYITKGQEVGKRNVKFHKNIETKRAHMNQLHTWTGGGSLMWGESHRSLGSDHQEGLQS